MSKNSNELFICNDGERTKKVEALCNELLRVAVEFQNAAYPICEELQKEGRYFPSIIHDALGLNTGAFKERHDAIEAFEWFRNFGKLRYEIIGQLTNTIRFETRKYLTFARLADRILEKDKREEAKREAAQEKRRATIAAKKVQGVEHV